MKILPFKIPKPDKNRLIYQVDKGRSFYSNLHQHEEIQVSIILSGEGDLVVGDAMNRFQENDVFIIGSNVPHLFKSDSKLEYKVHMLTLFFTKESFGSEFFDLPDLAELKLLFEQSEFGIRLNTHSDKIKHLFLNLEKANPLERFISLFSILKEANKTEYELLSTFIYHKPYSQDEGSRMSDVMNFAISNYQKDISLLDVANVSNMTPNAFCRYFKKRTDKSFFQFLLEVRIENACRLLSKDSDKSIAQISEESGFKNMSNFNRKFKALKKLTPSQYRKEHQTSLQ